MLANSRVDNHINSTCLFPSQSEASLKPINDIGIVVEDSIETNVNLDMLLETKVNGISIGNHLQLLHFKERGK